MPAAMSWKRPWRDMCWGMGSWLEGIKGDSWLVDKDVDKLIQVIKLIKEIRVDELTG